MIRIRRGREPARLPKVRRDRLSVVAPLAAAGTLERSDITGYDVVKTELWNAQHYKCCYCEKKLEASHSDIEHFRPALRARRGNGHPEHGYWWLAWTWQNLMFSCKNCNSSAKIDQFPLGPGSVALAPQEKPPGRENVLLIDPCAEDPLRHIQFRRVVMAGKPRWFPFAKAGSEKGLKTIDVLKLDRPELLDLYEDHVKHHIVPITKRLLEVIKAGHAAHVRKIWDDEVSVATSPTYPFAALSHDAIDHDIDVALRRKWKLSLRRP